MQRAMKKKSVEYSLKIEKKDFPIEKITHAGQSFEYAKKFYFDDIDIYESIFIILLNKASNTLGYAKISQGGISSSIADIKIIAKYAIDSLASAVILVHNHPSGVTRPSREDDELTRKVVSALELIDVQLVDHIIITENDFYSYADEGRI